MQFPKATEKKISDISSGNKSSKSSYISDFTQYFFGKIKATVFRQIYVDICRKKNKFFSKLSDFAIVSPSSVGSEEHVRF